MRRYFSRVLRECRGARRNPGNALLLIVAEAVHKEAGSIMVHITRTRELLSCGACGMSRPRKENQSPQISIVGSGLPRK